MAYRRRSVEKRREIALGVGRILAFFTAAGGQRLKDKTVQVSNVEETICFPPLKD